MTAGNLSPSNLGARIRRRVLESAYAANKGHLGSALSICEIVAAIASEAHLFGSRDADRDRVVLSKGHASLAFYCTLVELGVLDEAHLRQYSKNGSLLQTHPDVALAGVDFSTGSLGMGLGYGVGATLGARLLGSPARTFVILSDSELNEGSTWESAALAGTLELGRLTVILDFNGQQALGFTNEVLRVGDPAIIWHQLGFEIQHVDGHDFDAIRSLITQSDEVRSRPRLVIANTNSGHGVSFMKRRIEWHYKPMTQEQYVQALREVDQG